MTVDKQRISSWKVTSNNQPGFHQVIKPGVQDCRSVSIYRLNQNPEECYELDSKNEEMNLTLIQGRAKIRSAFLNETLNKFDSLTIPGKHSLRICAEEKTVFYIGAAVCEGYGEPMLRRFNQAEPLGHIHQLHGKGAAARHVYFTLGPENQASRLICGLTWGQTGGWTSWPPHQHEKDLEEVYCYFDINSPNFAVHFSYLASGAIDDAVPHVVHGGDMVLAPCGYHPTVASPNNQCAYFWVLAAHSHASRRYDLSVNDPSYTM